jgi:putative spermidine/putrescine transport system ATP-binding protein
MTTHETMTRTGPPSRPDDNETPAPSGSTRAGRGLHIRGLHKVLGGRTIIDDLDLTVQEGELVSLLGPSGCGKTTTLRMIAGFLQPDSGSIEVQGQEVSHLGAEKRPSAMVFQNYALWPHMTVANNVGFPLKLRKLSKAQITERVETVLELVACSITRIPNRRASPAASSSASPWPGP